MLTEEQARGFHAQMLILSGLQLGFEAKVKQFGQTDVFGGASKDTKAVVARIDSERHAREAASASPRNASNPAANEDESWDTAGGSGSGIRGSGL